MWKYCFSDVQPNVWVISANKYTNIKYTLEVFWNTKKVIIEILNIKTYILLNNSFQN